jgi:ATP-grasp domain
MSSFHFSNFQIKDDAEYFFYIGELKNYGLNLFLRDTLSRIHDRKFEFIAIVPDVFEQYNYGNLIVINPLIDKYKDKYGANVHCRISAKDFMSAVSEDRQVRSLIKQILQRQSNLFIYMYESLCEMTLDNIPGVSILGPDKVLAKRLNNKAVQMSELQNIVPVVDFKIVEGYDEVIRATDLLWNEWSSGIFVTKAYSAAGINSIVAFSRDDIEGKFKDEEDTYVITRFLPHKHDPTVLAVVANENEVYIAGVADQRIENGNRFTGSTFPTVLPETIVKKLEGHTRAAGSWLAKQGYRGIFGCDYIVTDQNEIRFLEINARKQGTTIEFCCSLAQTLPEGAPNLPELEYFAVTKNIFPEDTIEINSESHNVHWGTFNYKIHETVKTQSYIPQSAGEPDGFEKIARGNLKKHFLILEHAGSDFVIAKGAFIARIVALGKDHESVNQGINQGCKTIELTYSKETLTE